METGYSDRFSAVRSIKKTNDGKKTVKRVHDNDHFRYAIRDDQSHRVRDH